MEQMPIPCRFVKSKVKEEAKDYICRCICIFGFVADKLPNQNRRSQSLNFHPLLIHRCYQCYHCSILILSPVRHWFRGFGVDSMQINYIAYRESNNEILEAWNSLCFFYFIFTYFWKTNKILFAKGQNKGPLLGKALGWIFVFFLLSLPILIFYEFNSHYKQTHKRTKFNIWGFLIHYPPCFLAWWLIDSFFPCNNTHLAFPIIWFYLSFIYSLNFICIIYNRKNNNPICLCQW